MSEAGYIARTVNLSCVRLLRVGGTRGNERVLVEATMPGFLPSPPPPPPGGSDSQGNIKRASPAHKWVRFWLWPVLVWQKAVGRKKGWTKVEALSGLKGPTLWGHHFLLLIAPQATQRASSRLFEGKERGRIRFLNKAMYYQTTLNSNSNCHDLLFRVKNQIEGIQKMALFPSFFLHLFLQLNPTYMK